MRSGLVLLAGVALLSACAREEEVKSDRPRQIDLVEPSEAPFDLVEEGNSAGAGNCPGSSCETKSGD